MPTTLKKLRRRIDQLKTQVFHSERYARYANDPVGYCHDILKVKLWSKQIEIAELAVTPPYKVLVRSGHNCGKSFLAACLVNWRYDTYDPGITLTTAPTDRQVKDILWKEVRRIRRPRGGFPGPKMCRLADDSNNPEHYAHGFTARDGSSFQGQHEIGVFIVFDEAEGISPIFWEAAQTMLGGSSYGFVAFYNPTTQDAQTVEEERSGNYHLVTMSSLDHPNIAAEVAGRPAPYPSAIRLGRLREMLSEWSTPLDEAEATAEDVQLDGRWYRPGPIAQARLLGIRPTTAFYNVWSEALWRSVLATRYEIKPTWPVQIGCDPARFGDDFTVIHVRQGLCSLHHESHNGWDTLQIGNRLRMLCHQFHGPQGPRSVPVLIDETGGLGAGIVDHCEGYNFQGVNASEEANAPDEYPNVRSELWFDVVACAKQRLIDVSRLDARAKADIGRQLSMPMYFYDRKGRLCVEEKKDTKKRLKCSPDHADGYNLAWRRPGTVRETITGRV